MLQIQKRNQNWMPSVFDELFWNDEEIKTRPSMNVTENDKQYNVHFTAPGFRKEDASVSVENGLLTVSLNRKETKETDGKYLRREFVSRSWSQSFELPDDADAEKITASMSDGILSVTLPKYEAKPASTKQIEIC